MPTVTEAPGKRGPGRPKGTPASEAQRATGKVNAKASAKARRERKQARAAELEKPRWKQLEDGELSVRDLTMDELLAGEVANNDGTWEGRRHRFDTRWLSRFETERRRRIRNGIDKLGPDALAALEEIINDDEHNQRFAATKMVLEYQVGKVPDVIHVGQETEWDRLGQTAFVVERGEASVVVEDDDIIDGEVVEDA